MTILATMPGRFGDILWSLPTVRLLASRHNGSIDFMTSPKYSSILDLVQRQPYILETWTGEGWEIQETAPITPVEPPACDCDDYETIYHLGYRKWPAMQLAYEFQNNAGLPQSDERLHLEEPWITVPGASRETEHPTIAVGFSEEHIELKMGVLLGIAAELANVTFQLLLPPEGVPHRAWEWAVSAHDFVEFHETTWEQAAAIIATSDLFFGCLSSMWVLANAVGTPTVIVEPSHERHHPIFWRDSPKNHLVIGNDGKPTFDRRHTIEMIDLVLEEVENGKAD